MLETHCRYRNCAKMWPLLHPSDILHPGSIYAPSFPASARRGTDHLWQQSKRQWLKAQSFNPFLPDVKPKKHLMLQISVLLRVIYCVPGVVLDATDLLQAPSVAENCCYKEMGSSFFM